jgi:hypothetical protein
LRLIEVDVFGHDVEQSACPGSVEVIVEADLEHAIAGPLAAQLLFGVNDDSQEGVPLHQLVDKFFGGEKRKVGLHDALLAEIGGITSLPLHTLPAISTMGKIARLVRNRWSTLELRRAKIAHGTSRRWHIDPGPMPAQDARHMVRIDVPVTRRAGDNKRNHHGDADKPIHDAIPARRVVDVSVKVWVKKAWPSNCRSRSFLLVGKC